MPHAAQPCRRTRPAASPPALDRDIEATLASLRGSDPALTPGLTIDQLDVIRGGARRAAEKSFAAGIRSARSSSVVRDVMADGRDGPSVPLLILSPREAPGPVPVIFWIHGGGMFAGNRRSGIHEPMAWAADVGATVVSVEYRLAPEHPHPAPLEDCLWGLTWMVDNAEDFGIDASRILLAGISAGGGLAAAMALVARDRGYPNLLGQMLLCPMLDDRGQTASSMMLDGEGVWDRTSNQMGWSALLGDLVGTPGVPAYAAPARATDLTNLPPTYLDVGSSEILRDEIINYASRIWHEGGDAELHVWAGGCHGFHLLAPAAELSRQAMSTRRGWIRRLLRSTAT